MPIIIKCKSCGFVIAVIDRNNASPMTTLESILQKHAVQYLTDPHNIFRCPQCLSILNMDDIDYKIYPVRKEKEEGGNE